MLQDYKMDFQPEYPLFQKLSQILSDHRELLEEEEIEALDTILSRLSIDMINASNINKVSDKHIYPSIG